MHNSRDNLAFEASALSHKTNINSSPNRNLARNNRNSRHKPVRKMNNFERMRTEMRQRIQKPTNNQKYERSFG